jgi:hypothetical protein
MSTFKILVIAAICVGLFSYYERQQDAKTLAEASEAASRMVGSNTGFVTLPPASGHDSAAVVVVAPAGCPLPDAKRADELAQTLTRAGVRVQQTNAINMSGFDPGEADRINSVLSGQIPIVFVGRRAKANPSLQEVLVEAKAAGLL